MQIFKKNFFWYIFGFTTFIVSIYFLIFSDRLHHHKFVQDRIPGDILLKAYYDYENLEKILVSYDKFVPDSILKRHEFQSHMDNIFAKIVRFTQTNKNYKYEYRDYKELNKKEFKELEKILNNISLEGAYFLSPKHLDKVTINLFTSKNTQKEKFLDYYRFIIDREVDKYIGIQPSELKVFSREKTYSNLIAEVNLIRHLNHEFLNHLNNEIKWYPNITKNISPNLELPDINYLLDYLKCSFYEIGNAFEPLCKIIDDQAVETIVIFYEKLHSIKLKTFETIKRHEGPKSFHDITVYQGRSLFDKLITEWVAENGYNDLGYYKILSKAFSKEYLKKVQLVSELGKKSGQLNENFNYRFLNSKNYNTKMLKEKIFLNLKEVETKKNYFELLSFIIFALIFSFTANIIYRSFLDKK